MKVVIMAGGKGTRIQSVSSEVPKPMIPILDKPILEYEIECLKRQGYTDIIMIVGHLGQVIQDHFQDGEKYGVTIQYLVEKEPLGTAGALFLLKDQLQEDFLLLNGDIIFDVNLDKFVAYHREKGGDATILTHPNAHPYDSGIIVTDQGGMVTDWLHKEDPRLWYQNRVNAGLHILSPAVLEKMTELKKTDLDREILKPLVAVHKLAAYDSPEYIKDMGTPDRYFSVTEDIRQNKVWKKNLHNKQKAIFLDRDGVINRYVGFLRNINDFELLEGVTEAIGKINHSGYLAIVVTNQPVIARGEVSWAELKEIHNKMETLLGQDGVYVDDIFCCPHHPHKGYEGERPEYKIECECRKPKPGMLLTAAEKYNIDLAKSYMIGDSASDMEAGKAAGCQVAFVGKERIEGSEDVTSYNDLLDAINHIL